MDRSDESGCGKTQEVAKKTAETVFKTCVVESGNPLLGVAHFNGLQCGRKCMPFTAFCRQQSKVYEASYGQEFDEAMENCPEVIKAQSSSQFCKNFTFWETRPCGSRNRVRRCTANSPGQCYFVELEKVTCGKVITYQTFVDKAKCADKSDLKCPMIQGSSCEGELVWACRDRSFCLPHDHVCVGFVQCLDGSDEDDAM